MSEKDPRPPIDDLGFNDPAGWGYCEYCAYEVSVKDGLRVEHRLHRNGYDDASCLGSGTPPTMPTPLESSPRQILSFLKEEDRARRKAYWQRQRCAARAAARRRLAEIKSTPSKGKVTVVSAATGEEVDVTDAFVGPVYLSMEDGDGRDMEE